MSYPTDLKYTKEHEWVRVDGGTGTVGITDFAQQQLGDVVYVEVPEIGATVSGEVVETNRDLKDRPDHVNSKPHETWLVKVKLTNPGETSSLLDAAAYEALIAK
jgi:glycine cleavage system H protein